MDGFSFSTEVKVRFAETDAQGIAHHASFLVWFEVARVEYLERHAGGYQSIRDRGIEALTTEVHVRYHRAALFRRATHGLGPLRRRPRRPLSLRVPDHPRTTSRSPTATRCHATVDRETYRPIRVPAWLAEAVTAPEE